MWHVLLPKHSYNPKIIYIPDTLGAINLHMPRVCHWIIEVDGWKSHIKFQYVNGNSCQYRSPSICPVVWCTRGETSTAVEMFWACDERKYTYYMIQWTFAFQLKLKSNEKIKNEKKKWRKLRVFVYKSKEKPDARTWYTSQGFATQFQIFLKKPRCLLVGLLWAFEFEWNLMTLYQYHFVLFLPVCM